MPLVDHLATDRAAAHDTVEHDALAALAWRDRRRSASADVLGPGCFLRIGGGTSSRLVGLGEGVVHLGRGMGATLSFDDVSVSRRHATIIRSGEDTRLVDDCSTNGTFLNGRRITEATLADGDVIRLGHIVLRYLQTASSQMDPSPPGGLPHLVVDEHRAGDTLTLAVLGELDLATRATFEAAVASALCSRPPRLLIDLSETGFIDAAGVHGLVDAVDAAQERGVRLTARPAPPNVQRVFALTGSERSLPFLPPADGRRTGQTA